MREAEKEARELEALLLLVPPAEQQGLFSEVSFLELVREKTEGLASD